jgi:hypothetical protein
MKPPPFLPTASQDAVVVVDVPTNGDESPGSPCADEHVLSAAAHLVFKNAAESQQITKLL